MSLLLSVQAAVQQINNAGSGAAITVASGNGPDYDLESTAKSVSVTIAAGDMLVFGLSFRCASLDAFGTGGGTVTYNGVALTRIAHAAAPTNSFYQSDLFVITNPATGTHNLTVTPAGFSVDARTWYAVISNADTAAGFGSVAGKGSDAQASPENIAVTPPTGGVAFDCAIFSSAPAAAATGSATVIRNTTDAFFGHSLVGSYQTNGTQLGWSWTGGGSASFAHVATYVSAAPAGAGIASSEALGQPSITAVETGVGNIASAEAAGQPAISATVVAAGVASQEAVGQPAVAASVIGVGGIASAEALGQPTITPVINAAGVASAGAIGQPVIAPSVVTTGIASAEALGQPAVAATVAAAGIASGEAEGQPAITPVISGAGAIASAGAIGQPALAGTIVTTGIASAEAEGQPIIAPVVSGAGAIASAEAIGQPALSVIVAASGIASAEALGQPSIAPAIAAAAITSLEAFGQPDLVLSIVATGIASGEVVGAPAASVDIVPSGWDEVSIVGAPTVTIDIDVAGIASEEDFGQPTIFVQGQEPALIEAAGGIASAEAFGAPTITVVPVVVVPPDEPTHGGGTKSGGGVLRGSWFARNVSNRLRTLLFGTQEENKPQVTEPAMQPEPVEVHVPAVAHKFRIYPPTGDASSVAVINGVIRGKPPLVFDPAVSAQVAALIQRVEKPDNIRQPLLKVLTDDATVDQQVLELVLALSEEDDEYL